MRTADKVARDCAAKSKKATCGDACEWADYKQGAKDATRSRDAETAKELREGDLILTTYTNTITIDKRVFEDLIKQLEGEKVTK